MRGCYPEGQFHVTTDTTKKRKLPILIVFFFLHHCTHTVHNGFQRYLQILLILKVLSHF